MQRTRRNEIIVGLFVIFSLIVLLGMTFIIRGSTGISPYKIRMQFPDVAGLEIGAPVLVSGFRLGRVTEMEPIRTPEGAAAVVVTAKVSRQIKLYKDAEVRLMQQGFLGDKRLEMSPGSPTSPEVQNGDMLKSVLPTDMNAVFSQAEAVANELKETLKAVREAVTDPARVAKIDATIENINKSTDEMRAILAENRIAVRETITNLKEISTKSTEIANKADKLLADAQGRMEKIGGVTEETLTNLRDDSRELSAKVDKFLDSANEVSTNANELVTTSREEFKSISARFAKTSDNVNQLLTSINEGKGTVGLLVNDPRPFNDLQESMTALKTALLREQNELYDRRLPYRSGPTNAAPAATGADNGREPSGSK